MQRAISFGLSILVLAVVAAGGVRQASAQPGLVLVAHGSPSPEWNEPVLDLGRRVAEEVRRGERFKAVRTAMLEAVEPDVPTAVAELESEGCDRIVAVPLFVAASGHTHFDVPAVLGIYRSPQTARILAEEGAKAARPKVPVTLVQTLSDGEILLKYAVEQVRQLSRSPKDEAIVVLAHGDPEHQLLVDRLMRAIATHCCGETGINRGDWAYIGVGQEYAANGAAAIRAALEHKKRVLVVGLYVSTSAAKIHKRCVATIRRQDPEYDPFHGEDVVFSEKAIIDHPGIVSWIVESAHAALEPEASRRVTP